MRVGAILIAQARKNTPTDAGSLQSPSGLLLASLPGLKKAAFCYVFGTWKLLHRNKFKQLLLSHCHA
jgi:hypothetical protein